MIILSQRDPKWSKVTLGTSPFTIGRYGCLLTDLSMLTDYWGMYKPPDELAKLLDFTKDGLILWPSLSKIKMKLEQRIYNRDDNAIKAAIKDPNRAAILQVDGNHWILATGATLFTNAFNVCDPWYGDRSSTRRYGNKITGVAIISLLK